MKKVLIFLFVILLAFASYGQFNIPITDGIVYYVSSATGSDSKDGLTPQTALKTLQKGVDKCSGNTHDYVILLPSSALYDDEILPSGTLSDGYIHRLANCLIYINKPYVHIIGAQDKWGSNVVIKDGTSATAGTISFGAYADYCSIENVSFSTVNSNAHITFAAGADYNVIKGCVFIDGSHGIDADAGDCVRLHVTDCYFEEQSTYGVAMHSTGGVLSDCVFKDNTGDFNSAVYITGAAPSIVRRLYINGAGTSAVGITVNNVNDVVIFDSYISKCDDNVSISGTNTVVNWVRIDAGGQGYAPAAVDSVFGQ